VDDDGSQWRKDFDTVIRAVFCAILLIVCIYVVFFGSGFTQTQVNFASGFIGAIIAYYLK
jgi:hypothetical protein